MSVGVTILVALYTVCYSVGVCKRVQIYNLCRFSGITVKIIHMWVPLGVLPKNESCNEDMMDILEIIQDKFVSLQNNFKDPQSTDKIPAELIFFGGDQ